MRQILVATLLVVCGLSGPTAAQTPDAVTKLLARPVSPGTIGLLAEHVRHVEVMARVSEALRHDDAQVRAAAARVIYVNGLRGLLPPLVQALEHEQAVDAAVEEIRAASGLGGAEHDALVIGVWNRLGAAGSRSAVAFARARGVAALGALPAWRAVSRAPEATTAFISATGAPADALRSLVGPPATGDLDVVEAVLSVARLRNENLGAAFLADLLGPQAARDIRFAAAHHVLRALAADEPLSDAVRTGLAAFVGSAGEPEGSLEVAVLELARRASGLPATTTRAWSDLLKDPPARVRGLLLSPAATRLLSAAERGSIGQTDGERRSLASRSTPPAGASRLQTPEPYPHGFFRAVLAAADCDVAKAARQGSALGAGVLRLRPDGRPLQVTPTDSGLVQPGCVDAVRALLVTHVSEARATAGDDVRNVIIPINPDFVACREARSDEMPRDVERRDKGDNDRFEAPKKTRNVPPVYPVSAQEDKTMGVVVLESVIAPTGCVSDVRVIRGVDFRLDLSALRAVSQWRFTPTLLRGTAVPVLMTVTVQFSLSP